MHSRERFTVDVQLMADPCLWRWEIRDASRGEVVENSWAAEWMAYESSEEAYRAGRQRLTSLKRA
jgi:hypothetical protein